MKSIFFFYGFFISCCCFSQAGTLDETFGDSGKVYANIDGECTAVALQLDGKILAGGSAYYGNFTVIRYLPDGSLDSSFGENGIVYSSGNIFSYGKLYALSVLPDKTIVASGSGDGHVVTVKYNENGSLDSSFGENGVSVTSIYGASNAIQVQTDGKILLAGIIPIDDDESAMLLMRFNADGSIDENFGDNGQIVDNAGYSFTCMALQQDGKIVAGGHNWPPGHGDRDEFSLRRYNTDGSPDESFGENGVVLTDLAKGNDVPSDLKILSDGTIVVIGITNENVGASKTHAAVVKYNSDGTLHETFGDNGIVNILFDDRSFFPNSLLIQQDEKMIITGYVSPSDAGSKGDYAMARLKSNGEFDSSFGANGEVITNFGESELCSAGALQADGKIILAGNLDVTHEYLLARYNNDEVMPLHFTYFNATPTNNGGITLNWQIAQENNNDYFSLQRSTNNTINFNELTRINSKGNSSQAQTYSYTDNSPFQGTNFYRLKQVDKDGKFSYSQIVTATVQNGLSVILYPNPVKDVLNIKGLNANATSQLSIINSKGNIVASTTVKNASYKWNLKSLSKGMYYLYVVSNDKKITVKFVKE